MFLRVYRQPVRHSKRGVVLRQYVINSTALVIITPLRPPHELCPVSTRRFTSQARY